MAGKRTRARRGNPKGKAFGFRGLRPANKSGGSSKAKSASSASAPSASSASAPSAS